MTNIIRSCRSPLFSINDDFQRSCLVKTTFWFGYTTFHFLLFEDKERLHVYHNKARMDYRLENLLQARLNKFAVAAINRDSVIIDLAYLIAGLVTITQSRLVHCMLQGVKHTDPTEWGNSHLSIGDKFVLAVWWTVSIFKGCSLISFQWLFCHTFQGQLSNILYCWIYWICTKMVFTTYTYNMLFANSLVTYWLYFNDIDTT